MHLCIYLADYKLHLHLHVSVPESLWIHLAYATAAVGICVVSLMDVSVLSHTTIALWDSTSIAPSDSEQAQTSICTHTCFVSCSLFFLINLKQSPSCLCHVSLMLLIIVGGKLQFVEPQPIVSKKLPPLQKTFGIRFIQMHSLWCDIHLESQLGKACVP